MSAELDAEERVGRITVRTGARPEASDYRRPALSAALEIERGAIPFAFSRSQLTVIGVMLVLSLAITTLVYFVTSTMVVAYAPLIALALIAWVTYGRGRQVLVRVVDGAILLAASSSRERIALDRVEGLGVGLDAPYSTVWVAVRERGRVLLLDGLTREEADLVSRRLRAVIAPSA